MPLNVPALRIELEGLKQNVQYLFMEHNNALNEKIKETFERTLTEEWVQKEINKAVQECLENTIKELSNNYNLQRIFTKMFIENINNIVTKN